MKNMDLQAKIELKEVKLAKDQLELCQLKNQLREEEFKSANPGESYIATRIIGSGVIGEPIFYSRMPEPIKWGKTRKEHIGFINKLKKFYGEINENKH